MSKSINPLIANLQEKLKELNLGVPDLSEQTGIPKDRIYKWFQRGASPKAEDEKKVQAWLATGKMDKFPRENTTTLRIPIISDGSAETDYLKVILALAKSNDNLVEQNKTVVDTNQTIAIANAKLADQLAKEQEIRLTQVNSVKQDQSPALSLQQIHEEIQELALSVRNVEQKMSSIYPAGKDSTYKEFEQDMKKFQKQKASKGSESGKSR